MRETAVARARVVLVTRASEYEALLGTHGTREQARFFLATRDQQLGEVERRHAELESAMRIVREAIPSRWRFARVDRGDLATFVFEPEDLVVAVGQDGLVANTAKYLDGQFVVGVNPSPDRYPGVLVRHGAGAIGAILRAWKAERVSWEQRTMVEARLDDGQRIVALNELFVGHCSHQSARYRLECRGENEEQSSSGVIVASGTGGTGWALSIAGERAASIDLPSPIERRVAFFVREPWPSPATGTSLAAGLLDAEERLSITSKMNEGGVIFGDGIERDRIAFDWGRRADLGVSDLGLRLIVGVQ